MLRLRALLHRLRGCLPRGRRCDGVLALRETEPRLCGDLRSNGRPALALFPGQPSHAARGARGVRQSLRALRCCVPDSVRARPLPQLRQSLRGVWRRLSCPAPCHPGAIRRVLDRAALRTAAAL